MHSKVRLRTFTGEPGTVHGKTEAKVNIVNISKRQVIIDKVMIGDDFMIGRDLNLNMRQNRLTK